MAASAYTIITYFCMSRGSLGSMGSAIDLDSEGGMLCDSWGLDLRGGGWSGALGVAAMTTTTQNSNSIFIWSIFKYWDLKLSGLLIM